MASRLIATKSCRLAPATETSRSRHQTCGDVLLSPSILSISLCLHGYWYLIGPCLTWLSIIFRQVWIATPCIHLHVTTRWYPIHHDHVPSTVVPHVHKALLHPAIRHDTWMLSFAKSVSFAQSWCSNVGNPLARDNEGKQSYLERRAELIRRLPWLSMDLGVFLILGIAAFGR